MKPFAERLREDRRLVILRVLHEQVSYSANSSVLTMALEHLGHHMSRDQVKTEISWLAEQGLVDYHDAGPVWVAHLKARGHEVVLGRAHVPGVARPSPR
jgi:hypothetical protein